MGKIVIFYHVFICDNVSKIIRDQLIKIEESGILNNSELRIFINDIYNGVIKIEDDVLKHMYRLTDNVNFHSENWYEIYTHIKMFESAKNENGFYLYMHTKGASRINHCDDGSYSYKNVENWRHIMEHFCVTNWRHCVYKLSKYDLVGCNYIPQNSMQVPAHYSGNFWWATTNFLKKLPDPSTYITSDINRFLAEFWIGTIPHKALCLYPIPKPIPERHNRCFAYTEKSDYYNFIEQEFENL